MEENVAGAQWRPAPPPERYPVPPRSNKGWLIGGIALALVGLITMCFCGSCFVIAAFFGAGRDTGDAIGLIEVTGVIASDGGGWTGTSSRSVVRQLEKARVSSSVKAVLIRIDSPGGTPAAAQEIYDQVGRVKEEKPVIVSIGDIGASGAYYLASAADVIFALPDSDVGSIGVILRIPNVEGLDEKIGVRWYVFTQGQYKDIGSPYRPVTPEEQAILISQMQVAYDHFIEDVARGRRMDEARVRELANGLTYPGTQAKELGLIDTIGSYQAAVDEAANRGGIEGEPRVITMQEGGPFGLFSDLLKTMKDISNSLKTILDNSGASTERPQER
jgi:protease-4